MDKLYIKRTDSEKDNLTISYVRLAVLHLLQYHYSKKYPNLHLQFTTILFNVGALR